MEILYYILVAAAATALTRFLPFLLFKKSVHNEKLIFLQKNSGIIIMSILLVYAISTLGVSEIMLIFATLCAILAIFLQFIFKNALLSIAISTILYMVLLRFFG